jgi:NAD(P)H-hydrate repair Nnr-like enzyme with NAD(P)H-hydrate dehydratase domain
MAALRGGAGLVRLAVPDVCLDTVAGFEPSYMTVPLPSDRAGRIALDVLNDTPLYARVDLVRSGHGYWLMELELIEPVLYLALDPQAPARFAAAIAARR